VNLPLNVGRSDELAHRAARAFVSILAGGLLIVFPWITGGAPVQAPWPVAGANDCGNYLVH